MKTRLLLTASALLFLGASQAYSEPPAKEAQCRACHGVAGGKPIMDTYPKLNGQNKGYLVSVLKAYKAGERKGGMSGVMVGQAKMLSDDEIVALAEYYSKQ